MVPGQVTDMPSTFSYLQVVSNAALCTHWQPPTCFKILKVSNLIHWRPLIFVSKVALEGDPNPKNLRWGQRDPTVGLSKSNLKTILSRVVLQTEQLWRQFPACIVLTLLCHHCSRLKTWRQQENGTFQNLLTLTLMSHEPSNRHVSKICWLHAAAEPHCRVPHTPRAIAAFSWNK